MKERARITAAARTSSAGLILYFKRINKVATAIVYHWLSFPQLVHLYSVGQMAPGPNMMMIVSIGEWAGGIVGAIVHRQDFHFGESGHTPTDGEQGKIRKDSSGNLFHFAALAFCWCPGLYQMTAMSPTTTSTVSTDWCRRFTPRIVSATKTRSEVRSSERLPS